MAARKKKPAPPVRRTRERRPLLSRDADRRSEIAERVVRFYEEDMEDRDVDRDQRLQRYAKYRQWTEGKNFPWTDSSDQAVPDMTEVSLRTQDTLYNAVLTGRPAVVTARAIRKSDADKTDLVDALLDTQFFVEQQGDCVLEEMAELFTNDPSITVFVPWVHETRERSDLRSFDPIPENVTPGLHFAQLLKQEFPGATYRALDAEGWDFELEDERGERKQLAFYTTGDGEVELRIRDRATIHEGPVAQVKAFEDVMAPPRAANLQIPGPKNSGGAAHVLLVDYPTLDEITRLQKDGTYNLLTKDDLEKLRTETRRPDRDAEKRQLDALAGTQDEEHITTRDPGHKTLTRLLCFDIYDLDDKASTDVMWWVLLESKLLLRAERLTEMYPFDPPRRPLAEGTYLPIKGRRHGISLLELTEGLHDWRKEMIDQMVDGGSLTTAPIWAYRAGSNVKPETLRVGPGDGIPLTDVERDIKFFDFNNTGQSFGLNVTALIQQMEERLTLQGDIQSGRVPIGRSSALRTVGGIQSLLSQGEARPERILRRFFTMLTDVFKMYHQLNVKLLPDGKEFRSMGFVPSDQNPYQEVRTRKELDGHFVFDFTANVQNASKQMQQNSLQQIMAVLVNPLMVQLGIVGPDEVYRMATDATKSFGQNPNRYTKPPSPGALRQRITAEDALTQIMEHRVPMGLPLEGAAFHLEKLQQYVATDQLAFFDQESIAILRGYLQQLSQQALQDKQQAQLIESARADAGGGAGNGSLGLTEPGGEAGSAVLQGSELRDESLPGAGGGGSAAR